MPDPCFHAKGLVTAAERYLVDRRQFLKGTLAGLAAVQTKSVMGGSDSFSKNPFTLGVASGDATDGSVVLWTRIAPEPLSVQGGIGDVSVPVRWRLATDASMSKVIRQGESLAHPELAHSVHVELDHLAPGRHYWYEFEVGKWVSRVGRTRTLPSTQSNPSSVRFVTASCQNYTHGEFVAYEHIIKDQPEFVIHLGDYIYDTSFGESYRQHETEEQPLTLDAFRARHALYKTDQHLQNAHAQLPFFTIIDNHDAVEDNDASTSRQRAAAYQAWYEHMPVRGYRAVGDNAFELKRLLHIGDLAQISLLDTRQFRDKKDLCKDSATTALGFGNYRARCDALFADDRSMLGHAQEQWLAENLEDNRAAWNVLASSGPILPFRIHVGEERYGYIGAWDAYPANRDRLARALEHARGHPIVLSGDMHSFFALDGALVPDPAERMPLVEFVASSVSANWPEPLARPMRENLVNNPQIQLYDGAHRGYLLHDVTPTTWQTRFRGVVDARQKDSAVIDLETFHVEHGEPGMTRVVSPQV